MFNFSFINSFFLYGLALAGVPVIIHLVNRKKAVSIKFPTIRFIQISNKRVARKFKLRQIILLILRTLAVLAIVFLFARPIFRSEESALGYTNAPSSSVFIIDNSFSMLYNNGDTTYLESAVTSVENILVEQKKIDNATILTTCNIGEASSPKLTFDKSELLTSLRDIKTGYTKSVILDNFKVAVELLKDSSATIKNIYFVSDMQKNSWDNISNWPDILLKEIKEKSINVNFVDIAAGKAKNIGITSVSVLKQSKGKVSVLNLFSKIQNFSASLMKDILVKSYINDSEAVKGFVSLKSNEASDKNFFAPVPESGMITGKIELKDKNFAPDNVRYFSLKAFRTVRTLVVDGDPTAQLFTSETFYLNFGLNPMKDSYSKIEARIVTYDEFKKEELANYDVVILCNVEAVDRIKVLDLKEFVGGGGGLLFFLGDKVDPIKYNKMFGELLPRKLRDVYTEVSKGKKTPFDYIDINDYSHPILTPFEGQNNGDLSVAKFYKYFILQPSVKRASSIVLEFSSGNPCVIEKRYSKGRVVLFTSTADRAYNDLCIYPTYLPLVQQMTLFSANALGKEAYNELVVEDVAQLSVDKSISDVTVVDPQKNILYRQTKALKEIAIVKFTETYYPGFYKVYSGKLTRDELEKAEPIDIFAVNVNASESDFTKIDEALMMKLFDKNYNYITQKDGAEKRSIMFFSGSEIWSTLLLLVIIVLLLEGIISSSWRKKKNVKGAKWKEEMYSKRH